MKRVTNIFKVLLIISTFIFTVSGCGSSSSDSGVSDDLSSTSDPTGTLSISMVDAPGGSYQAVYVTLEEIQVCMRNPACDGTGESEECECEWETIATLEQTYNLLELVGGVMSVLGQKDLEPGDYNQMRLLLHDVPDDSLNIFDEAHPFPQYLIDEAGVTHEMKVPSGYVSGIKLVHPFEIVSGLTTELILDFDVSQSVIKAGNSGKYRLKPTIKVIGTHSRAIVSGVVTTDDETPLLLEGVMVNAWHQDAESNWSTAMSTLTDADGTYMLYLDLGGDYELSAREYTIVASANGYEPGCLDLTAAVDETYPDKDFALSAADMVTVNGAITGTIAPTTDDPVSYPEDAPVISIVFNRTDGDCLFSPMVQTTAEDGNTAENIYNSEDGTFQFAYTLDLPEGTYDVTASCDGLAPVAAADFSVAGTDPLTLDFTFDTP